MKRGAGAVAAMMEDTCARPGRAEFVPAKGPERGTARGGGGFGARGGGKPAPGLRRGGRGAPSPARGGRASGGGSIRASVSGEGRGPGGARFSSSGSKALGARPGELQPARRGGTRGRGAADSSSGASAVRVGPRPGAGLRAVGLRPPAAASRSPRRGARSPVPGPRRQRSPRGSTETKTKKCLIPQTKN